LPSPRDAAIYSGGTTNDGPVRVRICNRCHSARDVNDRCGYGFHGVGTKLETGNDAPPYDTRVLFGVTAIAISVSDSTRSRFRGLRAASPDSSSLDGRCTKVAE
jgi:hypothetical protein